jgi:hypothetical protein
MPQSSTSIDGWEFETISLHTNSVTSVKRNDTRIKTRNGG